jgi:CubicO group peptidase (beta-lactamase class C family)
MTTVADIAVQGTVAAGFEPVRAEFERNLRERDELGAAFAVTVRGVPVVDLWGGVADAGTGRPWERDTLQLIFSGSKGIVVTALMVLVDRGVIELDAPVARYWPEFAAGGKAGITVRQVVTFTARLPGLRKRVTQDDICDPVAMAALLAAQEPETDPRTEGIMYGPFTPGWVVAELVRRTDGRTLDRFFAEDIARPHGLDIHFGLPPDGDRRVARTQYGTGFLAQFSGFFSSDDPLTQRVWQNPMPFPPDEGIWSDRRRLASLIPAINVVGTARSFAKLYGILAQDAVRPAGEPPLLLSRTLLEEASNPYVRKVDQLIGVPMVYGGGGYRLRTEPRPGPDGVAFGHDGGGGSANQAWPRVQAGVSYTMNRLIALGPDDKRASSLLKTLARTLAAQGES